MRVFLAGASGAIGRPLLRELIENGHSVTGMTRSPERAAAIRETGAEAVLCDVFDVDALGAAMEKARPEVVVHELTALPQRFDFRSPDYAATSRLRSEGTRILIEAAAAVGARRIVAQSIAFMYAPQGGWVKDEDAPIQENAGGPFEEAVRATLSLERQVLGAPGMEGLVLRYGFFYGPGTYYERGGSQAIDIARRRAPIVGSGSGTFSFVHISDAARATATAVERGAPGIYNIVDDEPAPMREWLPLYAEALGAKRPLRVPAFLARLIAGPWVVAMATELRGASNEKAKRELGWRPAHPSWRDGFRELLAATG